MHLIIFTYYLIIKIYQTIHSFYNNQVRSETSHKARKLSQEYDPGKLTILFSH